LVQNVGHDAKRRAAIPVVVGHIAGVGVARAADTKRVPAVAAARKATAQQRCLRVAVVPNRLDLVAGELRLGGGGEVAGHERGDRVREDQMIFRWQPALDAVLAVDPLGLPAIGDEIPDVRRMSDHVHESRDDPDSATGGGRHAAGIQGHCHLARGGACGHVTKDALDDGGGRFVRHELRLLAEARVAPAIAVGWTWHGWVLAVRDSRGFAPRRPFPDLLALQLRDECFGVPQKRPRC